MILVLRHGETSWNRPPRRCQGQLDATLSEGGRLAARALGATLPRPDAVYSSHLLRARETARCLLEESTRGDSRPPPPLKTDSRLAEANCGSWQGELHESIRQGQRALWSALTRGDPTFTFPGGESLAEVLARFTEVIGEIEARHRGHLALVVTHGGPMRLFLSSRGLLEGSRPGDPPGNLGGFRLEGDSLELVGGLGQGTEG